MTQTKAISKAIVSIGAWSATKLAVAAIVMPIFSRLLGAEGFGQYAYYTALLLLCLHPANFGMAQTLLKHIAERPVDKTWHRELARFAGTVNAIAAVGVGLGLAALVLLSGVIDVKAALIAAAVVGVLWCEQVIRFASSVLYGLRQEERATIPAAIGAVIAGAAGVALAAGGLGVLGALLGMAIAGILVAFVTLSRAILVIGPTNHVCRLEAPMRRQLLHFGMSSMLLGGLTMALYCIDIVLVRHLADDAQTGLYAAAVQWSQFVWFLPVAIEGVMLQSTSRLWAERRVADVTHLTSALTRYTSVTTAFLLLVVGVFADRIVTTYYGSQFEAASLALRVLMPGAFAISIARVMRPVIQAKGDVLNLVKAVAIGILINVALNVWLVPPWGAAGAAVATSLSFVTVAAVYIRILRRAGAHPFTGFPGYRFAGLCTGTGLLLLLIDFAIPSGFMVLVIGGLVGTSLYWAGVFWLGLIRVEEIDQVVESLPEPLRHLGTRVLTVLRPVLVRIEAMAWL